MKPDVLCDDFVVGHVGQTASSMRSELGHFDLPQWDEPKALKVLYSYNAPIAIHRGRTILLLVGWDGYSKTTSSHFTKVRNAVERAREDWDYSGKILEIETDSVADAVGRYLAYLANPDTEGVRQD